MEFTIWVTDVTLDVKDDPHEPSNGPNFHGHFC